MPIRKNKIVENNEFYGVNYAAVFALKELSTTQKLILCYIFSFLKNKKEFFVSNKTISNNLGIGVSTVSTSIKKLIGCEYVRVKSFDGRKRIIIGTKKTENLKAVTGTSESSLLKINRQPTKNNIHTVNQYNKPNSKSNFSKGEENNITEYNKETIKTLIEKYIKKAKPKYVTLINEGLLMDCKTAYLKSTPCFWDEDSQIHLPPLLYKVLHSFFRTRETSPTHENILDIFATLTSYKTTRHTNTISSYFRIYNHWLSDIMKTNSAEALNRLKIRGIRLNSDF